MNRLHMEPFQRCVRHPHQHVVGVCSACLRERLNALVEYSRLADAQIYTNFGGRLHDSLQLAPMRHLCSQATASQAGVKNTTHKEVSEKNVNVHNHKRDDGSTTDRTVRNPLTYEPAITKAPASADALLSPPKSRWYATGTARNRDVQVAQDGMKSPPRIRGACNVYQQAPQFGLEQEEEMEVVKKELEVEVPASTAKLEAPSFRFLLHEQPSQAVATNAAGENEEEDARQEEKPVVHAVPISTVSDSNASGDTFLVSYSKRSADGICIGRKSMNGVVKKPDCDGLSIEATDVKDCPSSRKKKVLWFSLSKPKSVAQQSQTSKPPVKLQSYVDKNGVLLASTPGRRSTSDQPSQWLEQVNLKTMDLGSIAESGGVSSTSSSWISSLFHMRKSSKSMLGHATAMETSRVSNGVSAGVSVRQSPKVSIDAGRLSWDGPRPSIRHVLKKIEAMAHSRKLQSTINIRSWHAVNAANPSSSKPRNDVTLASLLAGATAKDC